MCIDIRFYYSFKICFLQGLWDRRLKIFTNNGDNAHFVRYLHKIKSNFRELEAFYMTGPGDIIRQASARRNTVPQKPYAPVPAPAPMAPVNMPMVPASGASVPDTQKSQASQWRIPPLMPSVSESGTRPVADRQTDESVRQDRTFRAVPQNIGGHAVYRELMRSHDRMGTRHIGKGG